MSFRQEEERNNKNVEYMLVLDANLIQRPSINPYLQGYKTPKPK